MSREPLPARQGSKPTTIPSRGRGVSPAARRAARPLVESLEARITPTTLPAGFTEAAVVSGLSAPTAMEFAPDGRLFVLEQGGNVKLVRAGDTTWTALHLTVDSQGERGVLGIAFDPGFASNHYVYLYYTNPNPGASSWATGEHNQLSRFTVDDTNPQQPTFTNEASILDWDNLSSATNHNGGAIHFGSDGMLYADAGDNVQTFTQGGSTYRVSQTLSNLLGKQLRINVAAFNSGLATRDDTAVGHLIPSDNPFVGTATGINQLVYALGLRNPYTFAVQPGTGKIFINDVGETTWEEIDQSAAGGNYGWSGGNTDGFGHSSPPGPGTYHDPLLAYNHSGGPAGGGAAIVGGTFYNPTTVQFPASYVGKYFYEDLSAGWIRVFDPANPGSAANPDTSTAYDSGTPGNLRDLKVDAVGNLYYLSGNGVVNKISYQAPQITSQPAGSTVNQGQTATFSVVATGPALSYQWQHLVSSTWANVGTNASTLTLNNVSTSDAGGYRVVVSNTFGSVTSNTATLTVNVVGVPPTITTRPTSQQANVGQPAAFSVAATGAAPLAYQWQHLVGASWNDVGTNSPAFAIASVTTADAGSYRVTVSNAPGTVTSNTVSLSVNQLPTATITAPASGTTYNWNRTITFAGAGTDPEDGTLAARRLSWEIRFYHEDNPDGTGLHFHPFQTFSGVAGGSFQANFPETSPYVWYRIILTATDSQGATASTYVDVHPHLGSFTLGSNPPGLQLTLDGGPIASGTTITGTVGQPRTIGVVTPQTVGGTSYNFGSWSDGGAASHTINTPSTATTYTATFIAAPVPGLDAEFFDYTTSLTAIPNLSGNTADVSRVDAIVDYPATKSAWPGLDSRFVDTFASRHTGFLKVDQAGTYTLYLNSDDGSKLRLDGVQLINNDGLHSMRERSKTVTLTAGLHAIEVDFFENTGYAGLILSWAGPGFSKRVVPASRLFHNGSVTARAIVARPGGAPLRSSSAHVKVPGTSWASATIPQARVAANPSSNQPTETSNRFPLVTGSPPNPVPWRTRVIMYRQALAVRRTFQYLRN